MNPFSIVIPSKRLSNLKACSGALRGQGETSRIIVIEDSPEVADAAGAGLVVEIIPGVRPFIFSRNCNLGLLAAGSDDVILMNDDAILESPRGLSALQEQQYANPSFGIVGASVNYCGTVEQLQDKVHPGLRELKVMLAFICVFIPRSTITQIGLLDERFGVNAGGEGRRGYGCDDDDYSWRVRAAGMKLGVYDGCFVNHTCLPSTFRDDSAHPADVLIHERVFQEKWGRHPRNP